MSKALEEQKKDICRVRQHRGVVESGALIGPKRQKEKYVMLPRISTYLKMIRNVTFVEKCYNRRGAPRIDSILADTCSIQVDSVHVDYILVCESVGE